MTQVSYRIRFGIITATLLDRYPITGRMYENEIPVSETRSHSKLTAVFAIQELTNLRGQGNLQDPKTLHEPSTGTTRVRTWVSGKLT